MHTTLTAFGWIFSGRPWGKDAHKRSLRVRFLLTAAALALLLPAIAGYGHYLVSLTSWESQQQIETYYGSHRRLQDAKGALDRTLVALHQQILAPGESSLEALHGQIARLREAAGRLAADPAIAAQANFTGLPAAMSDLTGTLAAAVSPWPAAGGAEPLRLADGLRSLLHLMERRIYDAIVDKTYAAMHASDTLSRIIWVLVLVIFVIVLAAYYVFEFSIRKPLLLVADALRAEGRGEAAASDVPMPHTIETWLLIDAFNGMRNQVQSRQIRLQSVLDNTSDGIITFDGHGAIDSANGAAARLFGYERDEIIGRPVSTIIPLAVGGGENTPNTPVTVGIDGIDGGEMELTARRKDGSEFTLSLKITGFTIDERQFYNALVSDISERKAMIDKLTFLAQRDSLTGLVNRRFFFEEMETAFARASRSKGEGVAVLSIDLDRFKYVNDSLGHQAGDRLLADVADRLRARRRKGDVIARLGGDEFAVLLYGIDRDGALTAAEAFRRQLADYGFAHDGRTVEIGCSIGVSLYTPDMSTPEDMMNRADLSMRMAKQSGRNRVHLFEDADRDARSMALADAGYATLIDTALKQGLIQPVFQPIAHIGGGIMGYEALARVSSAEGRLVPSDVLFPIAERFGRATDIDRHMIHTITAALARDSSWLAGRSLSFNLSGQSAGDTGILAAVTALIARSGLPPATFVFEITETAAVASMVAAKSFTASLRALGCRTALDDFGAGYCSFAYLMELPVDFLKLDGRLVREIHHDPVKAAVVTAINTVAHAMGVQTIAECAEDEGAVVALRRIGVDFVQGYAIGYPVPMGPWAAPAGNQPRRSIGQPATLPEVP